MIELNVFKAMLNIAKRINMSVRTKTLESKEIFVDVNDLIIFLMKQKENAVSDIERDTFQHVILLLTNLRDR